MQLEVRKQKLLITCNLIYQLFHFRLFMENFFCVPLTVCLIWLFVSLLNVFFFCRTNIAAGYSNLFLSLLLVYSGRVIFSGIASAIGEFILTRIISAVAGLIAGNQINNTVKSTIWFIAITIEHANRKGELTMLSRKCGDCHQLGHDHRNCPGQEMLAAIQECCPELGGDTMAVAKYMGDRGEELHTEMSAEVDDDCSLM